MAGDKLDENTKESQDAKQALSTSERNKQIRAEIGNDPDRLAERISGVDREAYDLSGFSDKEINMALQGGTFDENDYERLTGIKAGTGDAAPEVDDVPVVGQPEEGGSPIAPPIDNSSSPVFSPMPAIPNPGGYGGMNVQQDNDQISNVTGDGNTVTQNQDNSIGGYGGRANDFKKSWMDYKFTA